MLLQSPEPFYPVVIAGGGLVGASFALALESVAGSPTLVVEAGHGGSSGSSPGFDARSTALSFGSSLILARLGLWAELAGSAEPIREIHVSDRGHFGTVRIDCASQQVEALGYVVENHVLGKVLHQALADSSASGLLNAARVMEVRPMPDGMALVLDVAGEHRQIKAGVVVVADGGRSTICSQLGIRLRTEDYQQQAIICNIAFAAPHRNVAYERFTDSGPMAILPLARCHGENRGALVWTVHSQQAQSLLALPEAELLHLLQQRFGHRLGRILRLGQRFCYPLSLTLATEQVRPGLVLLGNAAHTLHPVAGQGFNLALRDADTLAATIGGALLAQEDPAAMSVLQAFVARQEQDQLRTIGFSHYLTRLFSSDRRPLVWARKFGLASIDLIPVAKREFARQAMGLADRF